MHASNWKVDATMILTRREISAVLADVRRRGRRSVNSRMNQTIFRLATCCGLRASEVAGLKLSNLKNLDGDRPHIEIPKSLGKGGKSRRVPLWWDRATLDNIIAWRIERVSQGAKRGDRFVCTQARSVAGRPLTRFGVRARFLAACRCLGADRLETLTVHHGRHSFVSHALNGGRSIAAVRDAVGHSSIAVTSLYTHVVEESDETVGDTFNFEKPEA